MAAVYFFRDCGGYIIYDGRIGLVLVPGGFSLSTKWGKWE